MHVRVYVSMISVFIYCSQEYADPVGVLFILGAHTAFYTLTLSRDIHVKFRYKETKGGKLVYKVNQHTLKTISLIREFD